MPYTYTNTMKAKQPTGLIERLSTWKEIDINGRVSYQTTPGENGMIHCHVDGSPMQRVCLISDIKTGRISIWNVDAKIERATWRNVNNTCAEELRFDLRQIALDGAKALASNPTA